MLKFNRICKIYIYSLLSRFVKKMFGIKRLALTKLRSFNEDLIFIVPALSFSVVGGLL